MSDFGVDDPLLACEFSYGQVVAILAETFGAKNDRQVRSLRGKLKRYQLDGLAPPTVGRGRAIPYKINHVYDWGFALTLDSLGFDPRFVVKEVISKSLEKLIELPEKRHEGLPIQLESDIYLVYFPSIFLDYLDGMENPIQIATMSQSRLMHHNGIAGLFDGKVSFALSNLSDLKRRIDRVARQSIA